MMRPLNYVERAEAIMDRGPSNLNFSVISTYRGKLNMGIVKEGIERLQKIHPLLKSAISTAEKIDRFVQAAESVPLTKYAYLNEGSWKEIAKKDLAGRFEKENAPLWRVSFLEGDNKGQLIVTFHHAIADGVCSMQMMHHFYQILNELLGGEKAPDIIYDALPDLANLHRLPTKPIGCETIIPVREDKRLHTTFVKESLDADLMTGILDWTKSQGIKVNATIFAAFLQAARRVVNPDFQEFNAITVVNYRPFFDPPFSKDALSLLRTMVAGQFPVSGSEDLATLAKAIHENVHSQLSDGEPIKNLKELERRMSKNPTAQELWSLSKVPPNSMIVTNLGSLEFSGKYSKISMEDLFFVANIEPFVEAPTNFVLGFFSLAGRLSLSLWFLEELVETSVGEAVLKEMRMILEQTVEKFLLTKVEAAL